MDQPEKFGEQIPLKAVRKNEMYTIKNHSLNSLKCDDNGAYKLRVKSDGGELKAQVVHQNEKGVYYYKERDRGNDHNVIVPTSNICTVERYYRHNKSIPSLRHLIVRPKQVNEPDYKPHFCIIYANSSDELEKTHIIKPPGNSKTVSDVERPYIRTSKEVLHQQ